MSGKKFESAFIYSNQIKPLTRTGQGAYASSLRPVQFPSCVVPFYVQFARLGPVDMHAPHEVETSPHKSSARKLSEPSGTHPTSRSTSVWPAQSARSTICIATRPLTALPFIRTGDIERQGVMIRDDTAIRCRSYGKISVQIPGQIQDW